LLLAATASTALILCACAPRPAPCVDLTALPDALQAGGGPRPVEIASEGTSLDVIVGGDVVPHRPMLLPVQRLHAGLDPLAALLSTADVAVVNYESATGDPATFDRAHAISLGAPAAWLTEVGTRFHAVTVANNHACDLGTQGLAATLAAARQAGVLAVGGDADRDPWRARVIDERDGRKVCAVAWTTFVNTDARACRASGTIAIAGFDREGKRSIQAAVLRARMDGCDGVVAILHGGQEYTGPIWGVRAQARIAADAGADAVVVHHPHVPAPAVVMVASDGRKVPVFQSVGNLLSNQGESWATSSFPVSPKHLVAKNAWTRLGVLADLRWSWPAHAAPADRPSFTYGYHLTWTDNDHVRHWGNPMPHISTRPLDPQADRALIERLSSDELGPVRLFTDPCWVERSGARCVMREAGAVAAVGS
jgi:poly-gamma-glutamate synthesis protein (capsule biosynthesis protein)